MQRFSARGSIVLAKGLASTLFLIISDRTVEPLPSAVTKDLLFPMKSMARVACWSCAILFPLVSGWFRGYATDPQQF